MDGEDVNATLLHKLPMPVMQSKMDAPQPQMTSYGDLLKTLEREQQLGGGQPGGQPGGQLGDGMMPVPSRAVMPGNPAVASDAMYAQHAQQQAEHAQAQAQAQAQAMYMQHIQAMQQHQQEPRDDARDRRQRRKLRMLEKKLARATSAAAASPSTPLWPEYRDVLIVAAIVFALAKWVMPGVHALAPQLSSNGRLNIVGVGVMALAAGAAFRMANKFA